MDILGNYTLTNSYQTSQAHAILPPHSTCCYTMSHDYATLLPVSLDYDNRFLAHSKAVLLENLRVYHYNLSVERKC